MMVNEEKVFKSYDLVLPNDTMERDSGVPKIWFRQLGYIQQYEIV